MKIIQVGLSGNDDGTCMEIYFTGQWDPDKDPPPESFTSDPRVRALPLTPDEMTVFEVEDDDLCELINELRPDNPVHRVVGYGIG